jgi:hypothetical protein
MTEGIDRRRLNGALRAWWLEEVGATEVVNTRVNPTINGKK